MLSKVGILLAALLAAEETATAQIGASNWRSYQIADGLTENSCASVTIGPHGKVWVQHPKSGGISSLDGYSVTNFPSPGGIIGRIYESPVGQIWTVCQDGLEEFRDDKWNHYLIDEVATLYQRDRTNLSREISLCPVGAGRVLFLMPDGLRQFLVENPGIAHTTMLRAAGTGSIGDFSGLTVSARDSALWLAGTRGLAHASLPARATKPETAWTEYVAPESLGIHNLREPVEDEDGGITVVGDGSTPSESVVAHFDRQSLQWLRLYSGNEAIRFAWRGPDRSYWAATATSLFQIENKSSELVPAEETSIHEIHDLAVEPGGNFWLATSGGLFRYAPPAWQTPPALRALNSGIQAATEDAEGRLWIVTMTAFHVYEGNRLQTIRFPESISRNFLGTRAVFALADGTLVCEAGDRLLHFALGNGTLVSEARDRLLHFDPKTGQFEYILPKQPGRFRALGLLPDGTLCVQVFHLEPGKESSQLEVFNGSGMGEFRYGQPPASLLNEGRLFLARGSSLWLGSAKSIARYRDQKWQTFSPLDEAMPEGLTCMMEASDEHIWCGSGDKIWDCDGRSWRSIPRAGFETVNTLLHARDGSIWAAANNGLHRVFRGLWIVCGEAEGLPADTVLDLFEDRGGHIWAVTPRGVAEYHPEADPDPPQTYAQLSAGPDNTIREGAPIVISFSAKDKWKFTPMDRLICAYRLDEQEWTWSPEQHSVSLPELSPGKHYFQLKSLDRNWNEDPRPLLVEFAVVRPWYKEARLLLISAAGLGIALFFAALAFNSHLRLKRSYAEIEAKVALRTKQLEMANQELFHAQKMNALGTLAAGIAHDFNNILSIVKGSAQIIEDNLDNRDKIQVRTSRIKTVVEQGAGIVKAMLGFSRDSGNEISMCDINGVINETVQLLGDRFLREVDVRFQPTPSLPQVPASKDFIQQILLNLIFNAAEAMTDHRQVILSAGQSAELPAKLVLTPAKASSYIFVSVKDYGCGIAPDILPRIFEPFFTTKSMSTRRGTGLGLSMVYELARRMEGGLAVESTMNEGSRFTLIVSVRDLPVDFKAAAH